MLTLRHESRSPIASLTPLFGDRAARPARSADGEQPNLSCLIATMPRSGSWLLAEILWNSALVGEPHEYFRPDFVELWAAEWALPPKPSIRRYIDAAMAWTQSANGVFAAKLHWYQLDWLTRTIAAEAGLDAGSAVDLADWFPDPRYVLLRRRNTARQAISYCKAATTGIWFATAEGDRSPAAEDYDLQQIRWFEDALIDHESRWRMYLGGCRATLLEVCYEDLAADLTGTVQQVLDFLGLATDGEIPLPAPRLRAQSDASTDRVLSRYLAVRDELEPRPAGMQWCERTRRFVKAPAPANNHR